MFQPHHIDDLVFMVVIFGWGYLIGYLATRSDYPRHPE